MHSFIRLLSSFFAFRKLKTIFSRGPRLDPEGWDIIPFSMAFDKYLDESLSNEGLESTFVSESDNFYVFKLKLKDSETEEEERHE